MTLQGNSVKMDYDVINVSLNHILLKVKKEQHPLEINNKYNIKIHFKTPSYLSRYANEDSSISTVCIATDIFEFEGFSKVLLYFELDSNENNLFQNYIQNRKRELVEEFKKNISQ